MNLFAFYQEYNVCEGSRVVDDLLHVGNETAHSLVVDLILLQLANVEDADVIQPLAAIKASKYEELFGSNNASSMSLSSCWCLLAFNRMTPSHGLSVEHIEVIGRDDLLEGPPSPIITSEQVYLIPYQVCCMATQAFWR